jgi:hypothetical protein
LLRRDRFFIMSNGVETSLTVHPNDAIFGMRSPAKRSQKKWSLAKKAALINRLNPSWLDLDADVLQDR